MQVVASSLILLAIWIKASNGDVIFSNASFVSDGGDSNSDSQYAFGYSNGKLYHMTQPKTMSILDLATKKWSANEFSIDTDMSRRQYSYFSLNSIFFLFQGPRKAINGAPFDATLHFWNDKTNQFEKVSMMANIPAADFDTSYMTVTVPDPRGNIAYVASSIYSQKTSKLILLKLRVDFTGATMKANVDSISPKPLALDAKDDKWISVGCMSHNNDTLYTFVRRRPADVWMHDFNTLYTVDLRSSNPAIISSPLDNSTVRLDPYFDAYLIKNQIFVFGQEYSGMDNKINFPSTWSFDLIKGRWSRVDFPYPASSMVEGQANRADNNLPTNEYSYWYTLDQGNRDLYLKAINNTVFVSKGLQGVEDLKALKLKGLPRS